MRRDALGMALAMALLLTACGGGGGGGKKKNTPPPPNDPPVWTAVASPVTLSPGVPYNLVVTATDPDSDPLTMTAFPLPTNATFVDNTDGTGDFDFTPGVAQVGSSSTVTFEVTDGNNAAVQMQVTFDVVNQPPTLTAIPTPQTATAGQLFTIAVMATDPEGDPLTLGAVPLPTNATFTDNGNGTGDFDFTPDPATQCGSQFIVVFSANDGVNPAVAQNVQVDVTSNSPTLNPIPTPRQVPEMVNISFTVRATDPDGDPLTMTAAPLPPGGGYTDNGDGTGDFTFTPGAGASGSQYTVTFSADDGCSPAATQDVILDVIPPNGPPTLTPIASPFVVSQGGNLMFSISATDPDGDPITFSVAPLLANSTLTVTGPGMADFSFSPDYTQSGSMQLSFRASDPFNPPDSQIVQIDVSGGGIGTFNEVLPEIAFAAQGFGIDTGDIDQDGNVDLIAPDYDTGADQGIFVFLGDGLGGFTQTVESPYLLQSGTVNSLPRHPELGDFNGDGALDFVIPTVADGDLYVFFQDTPGATPDGTFTESVASFLDFPNSEAHMAVSSDFDSDGDLDLVLVAHTVNTNTRVLVNDGTGVFTVSSQGPIVASPGGTGLMHVAVGDINNDAIQDFVTSNFNDQVFRPFFGDDDGTGINSAATFTPGNEVTTPLVAPGLASIADYNDDGALDVALPHFENPAELTIWRGNGFGLFTEAAARPAVGILSEYTATGDLDGDGTADLIATAANTSEIYLLLGNGDATFTPTAASPIGTGNDLRVISVNDFNNDTIADFAVASWSGGAIHIFLGN